VKCCGEPLEELVANTTDAAVEKHVPDVTVDGNKVTVKVGSVTHPMVDAHYIEWIMIETKKGCQKADLAPGEAPEAAFVIGEGDEFVAAYDYCNLHGLWKA
jgi:superoxide reductase